MNKKILLAGAGGQLGIALQQIKSSGIELLALDSKNLDITDAKAVNEIVSRFRPDCIINAAAYTAVDKAESEHKFAFAVNRDGAENLAVAAQKNDSRMIHVSTDYVFDGTQVMAYKPDDPVNPINVYGESKLAGEIAISKILGNNALILRTAWVYAPHGKNFFNTMLRLMNERDELRVVGDQIGTPTSAFTLADAIYAAIKHDVSGTHHWTDAGVASWYDFAVAIMEEGIASGLLKNSLSIYPIQTSDYPTPAQRPNCSVLDKTAFWDLLDINPLHWREALRQVLKRLST